MPQFRVNPAKGRSYIVEASSIDVATSMIERAEGRRNVFGVERADGKGPAKFFLDRGGSKLWQISVEAAAVEVAMGGF